MAQAQSQRAQDTEHQGRGRRGGQHLIRVLALGAWKPLESAHGQYSGGRCWTHERYQARYVSRPSLAAHRREPLLQFPAATLDSALEPTLSLSLPPPKTPSTTTQTSNQHRRSRLSAHTSCCTSRRHLLYLLTPKPILSPRFVFIPLRVHLPLCIPLPVVMPTPLLPPRSRLGCPLRPSVAACHGVAKGAFRDVRASSCIRLMLCEASTTSGRTPHYLSASTAKSNPTTDFR